VHDFINTYAKDKIMNDKYIDGSNSWILQISVLGLLKCAKIQGITKMYATQLADLGKSTFAQLVDITNFPDHMLHKKALFVVAGIRKKNK
jgi:hypothetical protein